MTLTALDAGTGKPAWTKDLMRELPGQPAPYGFQLSPTPFENLIIVPALVNQKAAKDQGRAIEPRGGPYAPLGGVLLAFDQDTGKEVCATPRGPAPGQVRCSPTSTARRPWCISPGATC